MLDLLLKVGLDGHFLPLCPLYLLHFPCGTQHTGDDEEVYPRDAEGFLVQDLTTDLVAVWGAMEDLVTKGLVKSIGLSNCNIGQISRIIANCRIVPANLQVEVNVLHQNLELVEFCRRQGIVVTAFAPLGSPGRFQFLSTAGWKQDTDTRAVTGILTHPEVGGGRRAGRGLGHITLDTPVPVRSLKLSKVWLC